MARWRRVAEGAGVAAVYAIAARMGGILGGVLPGQVLPVWPPAGIALAVAVLWGPRVWPSIALGAFAGELLNGTPPAAALGSALANTAEPALGAWLLSRAHFDRSLRRVRDVFALVGLAGFASPVIGGLVGAFSYRVAGWGAGELTFGYEFLTWWLGDAVGVIVVAPAVLVWSRPPRRPWRLRRALEAAGVVGVLAGVLAVILASSGELPFEFLLTPVLLWAALRFRQYGATAAVLAAASVAVVVTARGAGPFRGGPSERADLLVLLLYLAVNSVTAMAVAAANLERRAAVKAREDFIAVASHELRTPLTPLRLTVQRLRRTLGDPRLGRAEIDALLASAERQVDRLVKLVANLLDASRAISGKLALEREEVDLGALVRDTAARFEAESEQAHCALQLHADSGVVVGRWDRTRLEQVIANLVSNALKFGAGKPVDVRVERADGKAVVEVRDQGVGIAAADQARIFDRYAQLRSPAGPVGGLGLGLFISREIVEGLGGRIRVWSLPGQGARFQIELPLRG